MPRSQPETALQAALSRPRHLPVPEALWLHTLQGQARVWGPEDPAFTGPTQGDDQLVAELRAQDPQ